MLEFLIGSPAAALRKNEIVKNRLWSWRDALRASYWFIPALMAVLVTALSIVTIKVDEGIAQNPTMTLVFAYTDNPEGARVVLSTIASSMITVAGTVFSLTMVVLSLTSQQYGPLILVHFMRDRGNQFVLGIFTATFLYCLLILRTIHGVENGIFIPHVSMLIGMTLAISDLAVLIYFIHHISQSIQGPNIIARIAEDMLHSVDEVFPSQIGKELPQADLAQQQLINKRVDHEAMRISARASGYLQMVDDDTLVALAIKDNLVLKLEAVPGQFIIKGQPLVRILDMDDQREVNHLEDRVLDTFVFGSQRTITQDFAYIFIQLSALAVRALSPGFNDPYTAVMVIDRLAEGLAAVLQRDEPSMYRYDQENRLRVIAAPLTFESLLHTAFDQIRHYGNQDAAVVLRLLRVLNLLWSFARTNAHRQIVRDYTMTLVEECRQHFTPTELARVETQYAELTRRFENSPPLRV